MTLPEFPQRSPLDHDETATERHLRSARPRPARFSAEALLAALPPAEPSTVQRTDTVKSSRQTDAARRRLVLAVAAAWLGGMITGATAIQPLHRSLSPGEPVAAFLLPPEKPESAVQESTGLPSDVEVAPSFAERQLGDPPATEVVDSPNRWHASLRDHYGTVSLDRILRDNGLQAGSLLGVPSRSDRRPMPSETAAADEPSWSSRPIEPREPLTPASYRQRPGAALDHSGSGLF